MFPGIFQGTPQEFWRENKTGDKRGCATYTVVVLLLILACQLAAKIRFCLGSFFLAIAHFRRDVVVSHSTTDLKRKSPVASLSINPHSRVSEAISDLDLRNLINSLDEKSHEYERWDTVIDRQNNLLAYSAKCCKPKDGPLKYFSATVFDNCSAEMLRDFYMDNYCRMNWDKTLVSHEKLEVDENNGTEMGRIIKKFPLLTAREYILAWRVWESKDGTFYCFSKACEHPFAPRQKQYVRVEFYRSGWLIRKVPGRNACEIKMLHQEDAGLNAQMAKLAFSKGIWSYVCKMDYALRRYSAAPNTPTSSIQKIPDEIDDSISGTETNCFRERKFQLMANGLIILLGGAFCMSPNLGVEVACAYILTKFTAWRGFNKSKQERSSLDSTLN